MAEKCYTVKPPECCDMRGMLSFYVLWLLSKRDMYGQEIAKELGRRKGGKPNPGTIYPALKDLRKKGLIQSKKKGKMVIYSLTEKGQVGFRRACLYFCNVFGEIFKDYENTLKKRKTRK